MVKIPQMMGRPPRFKTAEEMRVACQAYFDSCFEEDWDSNRVQVEPFTITGLGISLGLSRQALLNYAVRPEFVDTVKAAKHFVENFAEKRLFGGGNSSGPIFALKNFRWSDKTELEHSSPGSDKVELIVNQIRTMSDDDINDKISELIKRRGTVDSSE